MKSFILEKSIKQLLQSTESGFDTSRKDNTKNVQVLTYSYIPSLHDNSLTVKARVRSSNEAYNCVIQFDNIEFYDKQSSGLQLLTVDGSEHTIYPIRMDDNTVKVHCECLDFYYRFSIWNHRDKALLGSPPDQYVSTGNRGPVNPQKVSGMCKHLIKLTDVLKSKRILY